ncbi:Predicted integral membrane protein [Pseudomonas fluorescens]|uniref:Predicted integral membrane protein n=1 Tax=Pseudomonas fluorescens TaxID=294 RepID=A0A448DWJ7_PSEFL|nr:SRPBCC family protein [Pseudomonas fluorescens]VEF11108.1 Predicted integral membrane protein [Pseudomonas fluorescens]
MTDHPLIATHSPNHRAQPGAMTSAERALSLSAGGALLLHGWRKGGLTGALEIVAGAYGIWRGAAGHCRLKQALTPTPFEQQFSREHHWPISEAITRSVTINRPLEEVRDFIASVDNIGPLLRWVDSVEQMTPDTTRWTLRAPASRHLQTTLIRRPAEDENSLHWQTPDQSKWQHDISVALSPAPAGRGTQVKAVVVCKPAMGKLGYAFARAISLFSDKALLNGLQAIKQQLETGEVSNNRMRPEGDDDFFYVHGETGHTAGQGAVKTGVAIEGGIH